MTLQQSRQLRRNMTPAERRLWTVLRRKQLAGFRFRRQAPIGPFVADFFCPKARLIVEVDGGLHSEESHMRRDHERTEWLEAHGCRVFRVWNRDVLQRTDDIADAIYRALTAPPSARHTPLRGCGHLPPRKRGEGNEIESSPIVGPTDLI